MRNASSSSSLPRVPASFFGIVLGLAGLANSWRAAHLAWGMPAMIGEVLFLLAALAWAIVSTLYAFKWIVAPLEARAEADHAVQCCFIGLGGVATLLIAQGALPYARALALLLFALGAVFTLGFALWRTGLLWRGERDAGASTPILYLPTVAGGFVAGTTAAALGWQEWGQLAFGAALFSWLAIESVLLHRLYTAATLPPAMRPTLGIQLAPPAVGAATYLAVGGGAPDLIGRALIGYALLQALLLLRMARWIAEAPFGASYWAFTFGATALATAAVKLAATGDGPMALLAPVLFGAANLLVLSIALGTFLLLGQRRLIPAPVAKP
ncbi:dicarboxylate transporter/tellurite-resistance protein TehA [Sphingomonas morindae]|uniref:Dicarboxylate transporter/tellurite-resistance protein TehA n=1 Tax=Sphingomonas morindae TaxID=1541170 RepID=A0ABY4XCQ5_9SPHN|nr:dicarboxylate transporter/tellurite-resistance protein TehA [Sphingomonas morindae]USI74688.1 dicarboxylate transporter/tellurite-resistance protein TehA [Sphingomonas morindae]